MNRFLVVFAVVIGLTTAFTTISPGRAVRNAIYEQIDGLRAEVKAAIANYQARHLEVFTSRLGLVLESIDNFFEETTQFHDDAWMLNFHKQLGNEIPQLIKAEIADPNPQESFKAGALYTAAIMSYTNGSSDGLLTPSQIRSRVKGLCFRKSFITRLQTYSGTILRVMKDEKYQNMVKELEDLLANSNHTIPKVDGHQELEKKVEKKAHELKNKEESDKWAKELSDYQKLTFKMNARLPVYDDKSVDQYYEMAKEHFQMTQTLEHFVA